jgi:hypothetical protein
MLEELGMDVNNHIDFEGFKKIMKSVIKKE